MMNALSLDDYLRRKWKYEFEHHWLRTTEKKWNKLERALNGKVAIENLFLLESLNHTLKNGLVSKIGMWKL